MAVFVTRRYAGAVCDLNLGVLGVAVTNCTSNSTSLLYGMWSIHGWNDVGVIVGDLQPSSARKRLLWR